MAAEQAEELGGVQLPITVAKAAFAYFKGANVASSSYALLTVANANLLLAHGSSEQIDAFVRPELEGRFFGTMCLSEPQAGSSLSDVVTRAEFECDSPLGAQYRLTGNKMWISAGEHELAENIVHLCWRRFPRRTAVRWPARAVSRCSSSRSTSLRLKGRARALSQRLANATTSYSRG
jgi:acyl-CoA dehydrogenase